MVATYTHQMHPTDSDRALELVEVLPGESVDGHRRLSWAEKLGVAKQLVTAGFTRIELARCRSATDLPWREAGNDPLRAAPRIGPVRYGVVVSDVVGLDAALEAGFDEIRIEIDLRPGSDPVEQMDACQTMVRLARRGGAPSVTATLAGVFGSVEDGSVGSDRVEGALDALSLLAVDELSLSDDEGAAVPADVLALVSTARELLPGLPLRCRFRNRHGVGLANAWAALLAGVGALDVSSPGLRSGAAENAAMAHEASYLDGRAVLWFVAKMGYRMPLSMAALNGVYEPTLSRLTDTEIEPTTETRRITGRPAGQLEARRRTIS